MDKFLKLRRNPFIWINPDDINFIVEHRGKYSLNMNKGQILWVEPDDFTIEDPNYIQNNVQISFLCVSWPQFHEDSCDVFVNPSNISYIELDTSNKYFIKLLNAAEFKTDKLHIPQNLSVLNTDKLHLPQNLNSNL